MSFAVGILALAVWLCPNEVSEKWVSIVLDMVLKYQNDNHNELKLGISRFRYADKKSCHLV